LAVICGVLTDPAHVVYVAGHVDCWLLQRRGTTRLLQKEPMPLQFRHPSPVEPHALFAKPPAHVPSGRQQPPQLSGLHVLVQAWLTQSWFFSVQSVHALPPIGPHASGAVPTTHVFPSQHPFGHVAGPHVAAWQVPPWQALPGMFEQLAQRPPLVPHAVFCVPTAQMFPTQQPGHVNGLHSDVAGVQVPDEGLQTSLGPHALQVSPLIPHDAGVVSLTHWLPTQQPAHVAGLHAWSAWQERAFGWPSCTQTCEKPHAEQSCPSLPHAVVSFPATH
jgi:hypothetical protein